VEAGSGQEWQGAGMGMSHTVERLTGDGVKRGRPTRRKGRPRRFRVHPRVVACGLIVVIILLWEALVVLTRVSASVLPSPVLVAETIGDNASLLLQNTEPTVEEGVAGFLLAIVLGVPLGALLSIKSPFTEALQDLVTMTQIVPKIAIAPLFLLWLGFGQAPKILMAFLLTFFPITLNTFTGIRGVPKEMLELGILCRMGRLKQFWMIQFRYALPQIMAGIKISTTLVIIAALVQEFLGGNNGLGYLLVAANGNLNTPLMLATVVVVTVIGFVFYGIVQVLERFLIPWHVSQRDR
jgi:NitT/TauT family transport system permease protein